VAILEPEVEMQALAGKARLAAQNRSKNPSSSRLSTTRLSIISFATMAATPIRPQPTAKSLTRPNAALFELGISLRFGPKRLLTAAVMVELRKTEAAFKANLERLKAD
jgi:hypothetical protein